METPTTTSRTDASRAPAGEALDEHAILVFDGACGSNLQRMSIPPGAWGSCEGCNEYLNLTAPEVVVDLHRSFLDAGANVIETNTFGAGRVVLAEYGLEGQVEAINRAAVDCARRAADGREGVFVAGSCGPTTKLPSLGHISFDELSDGYAEQIRPLVAGGVDLLIFETCQDLLQAKLAAITARRVFDELGRGVPVMISITVETTGTMLTGADVAAAVATLEPLEVYSLGLNCATGPERMTSHIHYLREHWARRISMIPNAGMPQVVDGQTVYPLRPEDFARYMRQFILEQGVSSVGGCCGTTPEHIRALRGALRDVRPGERSPAYRPSIASGYPAVELRQDIPPLMIGERANANGSRKFRELLLADDWTGCLKVATDQEAAGAMAIDLCTAYAGRDERADMTALMRRVAESVKVPVVIDSTTPEVVEACLKLHPGRCVVNSINLEDGGENLRRIATLAARFGAACVALTINEQGMAMTADDKVATARAIHDQALQCGLRPQDLLFDPLTFTIGSGDETLRDAGIETLEAIRRIPDELPGVHTVLGLSNISFGLPPAGREVLNSVFLHEAVEHGLDAAIVDSAKILPLSRIDERERELAANLIYDRGADGERTGLMAFIDHFQGRDAQAVGGEQGGEQGPPEQQLTAKVVTGDKEGLDDLVHILLRRHRPGGVINDVLVPAMRHVGELFGRGEMLLPFVLQSAEVMKRSVDLLEPYMEKADDEHGTKILLATVQGDVHDIGKNLVDIILSNNGFTVFNIGTKVPAETIIEKAREHAVDVIGLSGLLVKSAIVMKDSLAEYRRAGLGVPILLGGAALTAKFVARDCAPQYDRPVVYCADAFAGLRAMNQLEDGTLTSTTYDEDDDAGRRKPGLKAVEVDRENRVPDPPFVGVRHVVDVPLEKVLPFVNEQALFRGRWGYRRGKMGREEYEAMIAQTVRPLYEDLCRKGLGEGLLTPKVAYGYFRAHGEGDRVVIEHEGRSWELGFPRQTDPPHLCIADYFHSAEAGGDVAGLFVATVGDRVSEATRELFEGDEYHDYLMMHAFSVEVTDALAEYWHEVMRNELGIGQHKPDSLTGYAVQDYQGSRYGFGYPACPDLDAHRTVFELLEPSAIGVTLTENMEMVPEQSTSAVVVHHPQAKYFAVYLPGPWTRAGRTNRGAGRAGGGNARRWPIRRTVGPRGGQRNGRESRASDRADGLAVSDPLRRGGRLPPLVGPAAPGVGQLGAAARNAGQRDGVHPRDADHRRRGPLVAPRARRRQGRRRRGGHADQRRPARRRADRRGRPVGHRVHRGHSRRSLVDRRIRPGDVRALGTRRRVAATPARVVGGLLAACGGAGRTAPGDLRVLGEAGRAELAGGGVCLSLGVPVAPPRGPGEGPPLDAGGDGGHLGGPGAGRGGLGPLRDAHQRRLAVGDVCLVAAAVPAGRLGVDRGGRGVGAHPRRQASRGEALRGGRRAARSPRRSAIHRFEA